MSETINVRPTEAQVEVPRLPDPISKESLEQLAHDALHGEIRTYEQDC